RRLRASLGSLEGRRIAVWGLTFKGDTEDTRVSPAIDVVTLLANAGASVQAYDPAVSADPTLVSERFQAFLCSDPLEAAAGAHALAILTDWRDFRSIDLHRVRDAMAGDLVFDGRSLLDRAQVEAVGLVYLGVGRVSTPARRRSTDR